MPLVLWAEAKARALLHRGVDGVEDIRCGGTGDLQQTDSVRRMFKNLFGLQLTKFVNFSQQVLNRGRE